MLRSLLVPSLLALTLPILPLAAADHGPLLLGADVATNYGDAVTFRARLVEPWWGCPNGLCSLPGRSVDFYVDGAYAGSDVTNSGGYAYLLIADTSAWHAGAHEVRAQYDRFDGGATTALSALTVSPEPTRLLAREGYAQSRLTTDDAAPLAGALVRFSLVTPAGEREVCHAYTDADGVASCVPVAGVGVSPTGAASYKATFDGTGDYAASTDGGALA